MMLHHQFAHLKSLPVSQHRQVTVQLAVNGNGFDHLVSIGFKTAVKIVDFNAGKPAGDGVKKLGRNRFTDGIVTFFLPAGNQIVSFLQPLEHIGNFRRIVLQVRVHSDHRFALGQFESFGQGGALAEITPETNHLDLRITLFKLQQYVKGTVIAAVVDKNDFEIFFQFV